MPTCVAVEPEAAASHGAHDSPCNAYLQLRPGVDIPPPCTFTALCCTFAAPMVRCCSSGLGWLVPRHAHSQHLCRAHVQPACGMQCTSSAACGVIGPPPCTLTALQRRAFAAPVWMPPTRGRNAHVQPPSGGCNADLPSGGCNARVQLLWHRQYGDHTMGR